MNTDIYTFNTSKFHSSKFDICFGTVYELEIDNVEDIIYNPYYELDSIIIDTIDIKNSQELVKNNFKILKRNVNVLCFTAIKGELQSIYRDRHNHININKRMFLDFL